MRRGQAVGLGLDVGGKSGHAVGDALGLLRLRAAIVQQSAADEHAAVEDFRAIPGSGVTGVVDGRTVAVGRPKWIARDAAIKGSVVPEPVEAARRAAELMGQTVVLVAVDGAVCGALAVAEAGPTLVLLPNRIESLV